MKAYVKFQNSKHNYTTSVNNKGTIEDITAYFKGTVFNVGIYPKEVMAECVDVDVTKDHLNEYVQKVYPLLSDGRTDFFKFVVIEGADEEIVKDLNGNEMYFDEYKDALRVRDSIEICKQLSKDFLVK